MIYSGSAHKCRCQRIACTGSSVCHEDTVPFFLGGSEECQEEERSPEGALPTAWVAWGSRKKQMFVTFWRRFAGV